MKLTSHQHLKLYSVPSSRLVLEIPFRVPPRLNFKKIPLNRFDILPLAMPLLRLLDVLLLFSFEKKPLLLLPDILEDCFETRETMSSGLDSFLDSLSNLNVARDCRRFSSIWIFLSQEFCIRDSIVFSCELLLGYNSESVFRWLFRTFTFGPNDRDRERPKEEDFILLNLDLINDQGWLLRKLRNAMHVPL